MTKRSPCLGILATVALLWAPWGCSGADAGAVEPPECATECPAGTRRASYTETSVVGQQAMVDGRLFLFTSSACETLCETLLPCDYPNVPTAWRDPATAVLHYACEPLAGYSRLEPDDAVDTSFAAGWQPAADTERARAAALMGTRAAPLLAGATGGDR